MVSKVTSTVPFDQDGKHIGYLSIPHSRNESAWGAIRIPIVVIRSGAGSSALLIGGNHGDEFEGPIALLKIIHALVPDDVRGTVIIMPALNYPALKAGMRLSPIDGGNMNRAFPGDSQGTITEQIAHYVYAHVLPLVDTVVDVHAGGRTMEFLPFAAVHELDDPEQMRRARRGLEAFGAPVNLILKELDAEGMLDTAAEAAGKLFVTTELGGGGSTTQETVAIAERGVRNVLCHVGILSSPMELPKIPSRHLRTSDNSYVICEDSGLVEYFVNLGGEVIAGAAVCAVHDVDRPGSEAAIYTAAIGGTLVGRCHGGLVAPGDFLGLIGFEENKND